MRQIIGSLEYKLLKCRLCRGEQIDEIKRNRFRALAFVMLWAERGVEWWLLDGDTLSSFETGRYKILHKKAVRSRIKNIDSKALMSRIELNGHLDELYALYGYDDAFMKKAIAAGQKLMLILGTAEYAYSQDQIEEFIKMTKAYYGDEYAYLYKGHPGNLPDEDEIKRLEALGFEVITSSVPTELILYAHPQMRVSGFPSTVFYSEAGNINIGGIFSINKDGAYHSDDWFDAEVKAYAPSADFFASEITEETVFEKINPDSNLYRALNSHKCYLMEFNDGNEHDYGIWDADEDKLTLYKRDDAGSLISARERQLL